MLIRSYNPIWFFNDLVGQPLDDTYYAFFKENTIPYIPQNVYQDPNMISAWPNPLEFGPNGGLPDNLYFNPGLVYRIEIRQGNTQNSPLIYLIENYVPSTGSGTITTTFFNNSQNLITNPQFADISFASPATFVSAGTYNIAPGWQLVLTGVGSTTLTQVALPGSDNLPGNPPYALEIANSGWTTAVLVQTFHNNGALFAGGSIALSMLVKTATNPYTTTMTYAPSEGTASQGVSGMTSPGVYTTIGGGFTANASSNTDVNGAASVQISITLPTNDMFFITNVQFIGQEVPLVSTPIGVTLIPPFQEISYERVVDQEFHVYRDSILNHPKNSILTGWNFANNPWQYFPINVGSPSFGPTTVGVNEYTADQTIVLMQHYVATASGSTVAVMQDIYTNNLGFKVVAVTAHNQFAILQYIDPTSIAQYWGQIMSSMVKAFLTTSNATTIQIKARLIYKSGLPGTLAQTNPIATWVEGSDPVAASGYTLIVPQNDPVYTLTSTSTEFSFNGFQLPASTSDEMTLGILIYTIGNMVDSPADSITFNDVSLVQNAYALPTQPETFDETLRKCQYYYEKSYNYGVVAGTGAGATYVGANFAKMTIYNSSSTTSILYFSSFGFQLEQTKRADPAILFYSPSSGTVNKGYAGIFQNGSYPASNAADYTLETSGGAIWTLAAPATDSIIMQCQQTSTSRVTLSGSGLLGDEGVLYYQYTANACLGNPTLP